MGPFSYVAIIYVDGKYYREAGMGIASSYAQASEYIEGYYGPDLISIKELTMYEDTNLIILSEKAVKKYHDDLYYGNMRECDKDGNLLIHTS